MNEMLNRLCMPAIVQVDRIAPPFSRATDGTFSELLARPGDGDRGRSRTPARPGAEAGRERDQDSSRHGAAEAQGAVAPVGLVDRSPAALCVPLSPLMLVPDLATLHGMLRAVVVTSTAESASVRIAVATPKLSSMEILVSWDGRRLEARFELGDAAQLHAVRASLAELEQALRDSGLKYQQIEVALRSEREGERRGGGRRSQGEVGDGAQSASPRRPRSRQLRRRGPSDIGLA